MAYSISSRFQALTVNVGYEHGSGVTGKNSNTARNSGRPLGIAAMAFISYRTGRAWPSPCSINSARVQKPDKAADGGIGLATIHRGGELVEAAQLSAKPPKWCGPKR